MSDVMIAEANGHCNPHDFWFGSDHSNGTAEYLACLEPGPEDERQQARDVSNANCESSDQLPPQEVVPLDADDDTDPRQAGEPCKQSELTFDDVIAGEKVVGPGYGPRDDFADDPEYLRVRQEIGPQPRFEASRLHALQKGFKPWKWAQYQRYVLLRGDGWMSSGDWSQFDPASVASGLRTFLKEMQEDKPGKLFDDIVTPAEDFLGREYSTAFLVEDALPAGQVCIFGGPEKGQKSNLLADLAVSLAAGTPWLGTFAVPRPVKVLLLTGETQGANLQNVINRILLSKGLSVNAFAGRLIIKEAIPTLDNADDMATLADILKRESPETTILDPLYFALGAIDSHRLTEVGQAVMKAARVCTEAGSTPILAHHMSKSAQFRRGEDRTAMQLADLNGAGFGPVAGSWLLVNYLVPYDPETGTCTLWLNVGGRAGHGGLYTLEIEEGKFHKGQPLNGRKWVVTVRAGKAAIETAEKLKAQEQEGKEEARAQVQATKREQLMQDIQAWLVARGEGGAIQSEIADRFGIKPQKVAELLSLMLERLLVVRARKQKGDNPKACRWRSLGGTIPLGKLATLLKAGKPLEDAIEECKDEQ